MTLTSYVNGSVMLLKIYFETKKLHKTMSSSRELKKEFPPKIADAIGLRLTQLKAANNLSQIPHHLPFGLHKLTGNRKNQYAVWAKEKYRIIFYALDENDKKITNPDFPKEEIRGINIIEVVNYHV